MSRASFMTFLVINGTLLFALPPAPSKPPAFVAYIPYAAGTKCIYECAISQGDGPPITTEFTRVIIACTDADDNKIVSVGVPDNGKDELYCKIALSSRGVFLCEFDDEKLRTPLCLLKMPLKIGNKWKTAFPWEGGLELEIESTIIKEERIEVPAGKFTAIQVDSECTEERKNMRSSTWYAVEIGPIKSIQKLGTYSSSILLKSITQGKK